MVQKTLGVNMILKRMLVVLTGLTLILCIFQVFCTYNVVAGNPQLSPDNSILYLHYDEAKEGDDRFWMNADNTTVTEKYEMTVGAIGEFTFNFSLSPKLDHTIYPNLELEDNVLVTLHLEAEAIQQYPIYDIWVEFNIGNSTIHSDAPDNTRPGNIDFSFSIGAPGIDAGTEMSLKVHFQVRAQTTFEFLTDATSYIVLALKEDSNGDGGDGDGDGGDGDGGDGADGNDTTGNGSSSSEDKEERCIVLAIPGVILITMAIVNLVWFKKRKA